MRKNGRFPLRNKNVMKKIRKKMIPFRKPPRRGPRKP